MSTTATTSTPARRVRDSVAPTVPEGTNLTILRGTIRRDPVERVLPSEAIVLQLDLAVRVPGCRAESVPVSWFDPPASSARLAEGLEVVVVGRVQRRFFRAGSSTTSRTEVIADRIVPVTAVTRVTTAVRTALLDLEVE